MRRLIIVRHGNTFHSGEKVTRIGARTDLPLVEETRSIGAAQYLKANDLYPNRIFAAPLKRTMGTASIIKDKLDLACEVLPAKCFIEIDYGPDENKQEDDVILRLGMSYIQANNIRIDTEADIRCYGENILKQWNERALVPFGWVIDVPSIINSWKHFAAQIKDSENVLVVSSNGIIRFAPHILDRDYRQFCATHSLKVSTGAVCIFENENSTWTLKAWNATT